MMNCGIGMDSPFKEKFLGFRKELVTELLNGSKTTDLK